jgi:hypothetical protein
VKASPSLPPPPPAAPEPPAPPVAQTPAADKPVSWPEWFLTVDVAVAVMVVVTAFLVASYSARNSDLWLHLAGGRLVTTGQLSPGADPFSQAADRPWANTSWLFDVVMYALYSAAPDGAFLVGFKAGVFGTAFAVLMLVRKSGQPLWPWVVLCGLGLLAAGPYAHARPGTFSMLFLAVTVFLVFRLDWSRPGWRNAVALGGLFAVWANVDSWFVLGPFTVGLVLLGSWLNRFLGAEPPPEQAVLATPPTGPLAKAFLVGLAACLVNPFVLGAIVRSPVEAVTQLVPTELGLTLPPGLESDRGELELLVLNPFSQRYYEQPARGASLNGAALLALAVIGLVSLAAGLPRLTAPHILLYVGFLALASRHIRLIPYFAVVVIPLAAAHLNGLSARVRPGRAGDPAARILLTGSGLGRLLTAVAAAIMLVAAYPGLLGPAFTDPLLGTTYPNRVEWAVEPDPGLSRVAQRLGRWRADGTVPADLRGLATSPDLGNYCAWFAPAEKVFANGRTAFHRHELADLLTVRRGAFGRQGPADNLMADVDLMNEAFDRSGAAYLVLSRLGVTRRVDDLESTYFYLLLNDADRWELWHLDGRTAVLGRTTTKGVAGRPRFDPGQLAFGPDPDPVPPGTPLPPPKPPESELDRLYTQYADRSKPTPAETDDALTYATYLEFVRTRDAEREKRRMQAVQYARSAVGGVAVVPFVPLDPSVLTDDQYAEQMGLALLALRAARTGAARAPDRPDVYLSVAAAHKIPYCPVLEVPNQYLQLTEAQTQVLTAQARFVARTPAPADCPRELAKQFVREGWELAQLYERTGQLDLARDTAQRVLDMGKAHPAALRPPVRSEQKPEEQIKQAEKQIEEYVDKLSVQVRRGTDAAQRQQAAAGKFQQYVAAGLPGKAIELFKGVADPAEFGPAQNQIILNVIVLELRAGRVEIAAEDLTLLAANLDRLTERPTPELDTMVAVVRNLQSVVHRLVGNYGAAADLNRTPPPALKPDDIEAALKAPSRELLERAMPWLTAVGGGLGGASALLPEVQDALFPPKRQADKEALLATALQQFDRALLALSGGNNFEARRRLELAGRPQGIELSRLSPVLAERVNRYLRLLRRYDPAGKPPG